MTAERKPFGALITATLLAGCSADTPGADSTDAPAADRPWAAGPSVQPVPEATSGDDAVLSYVWDLATDSRGHVYVVDFREPGIIELNRDLGYERTIGREGEGPGEFGRAATAQILEGDSLLVWDSQLQRLTLFPPGESEAASVRSLGTQERSGTTWRLAGGAYLARSSTAYMADGSDQGSARTEVLRHVREEEGRVVDEVIFSYPAAESLVLRAEGAVSVAEHPFGRSSFVGLLADGRIAHASSDALEVRTVDLTGDVQTAFSYPTADMPVSRRDLAAAADGLGRNFARLLREGAPYLWPLLTGLVVDDEGRIWIGLRNADLTKWEWAAFLVDGTHQLSVELPAEFEVHAVRGGRIIGVEQDELDVPRIRAYRLP